MPQRGALSNNHLTILEVRLAWKSKWACRCQACRFPESFPPDSESTSTFTEGTNKVSDHENLKLQTKYVSPFQKTHPNA